MHSATLIILIAFVAQAHPRRELGSRNITEMEDNLDILAGKFVDKLLHRVRNARKPLSPIHADLDHTALGKHHPDLGGQGGRGWIADKDGVAKRKDPRIELSKSQKQQAIQEIQEYQGRTTTAAPIDLSDTSVLEKYGTAARIANHALQLVIDASVGGADIYELCQLGDKFIRDECAKVYVEKTSGDLKNPTQSASLKEMLAKRMNSTDSRAALALSHTQRLIEEPAGKPIAISKGIAFPTCIAPNELFGTHSPLKYESMKLKAGDVTKIDLGCHIDGYIAVVGHTIIVPGNDTVTGKKADVIHAAWNAVEAALRLIQVGHNYRHITPAFEICAHDFGVKALLGISSSQMARFHMAPDDGGVIPMRNEDPAVNERKRQAKMMIRPSEVYCIDIAMSTGSGELSNSDKRCTIFERNTENPNIEYTDNIHDEYVRRFIKQVRRFQSMPFSVKFFDEEDQIRWARMAAQKAVKMKLVNEHPPALEREGETIACFQFTVLVLPNGEISKITGLEFGDLETKAKTDKTIQDAMLKHVLSGPRNTTKVPAIEKLSLKSHG